MSKSKDLGVNSISVIIRAIRLWQLTCWCRWWRHCPRWWRSHRGWSGCRSGWGTAGGGGARSETQTWQTLGYHWEDSSRMCTRTCTERVDLITYYSVKINYKLNTISVLTCHWHWKSLVIYSRDTFYWSNCHLLALVFVPSLSTILNIMSALIGTSHTPSWTWESKDQNLE